MPDIKGRLEKYQVAMENGVSGYTSEKQENQAKEINEWLKQNLSKSEAVKLSEEEKKYIRAQLNDDFRKQFKEAKKWQEEPVPSLMVLEDVFSEEFAEFKAEWKDDNGEAFFV